MPDIEHFFFEIRRLIDPKLEKLIPPTDPKRLYDAIRWSLFGEGKRFRPALVIAAGRVFGAADDSLLQTAASVEMLHTYSLIHDDLPAMDDDDLRRGRETAHKKFDEATAILAGDALQAMAFEVIACDELLEGPLRLQLVSELVLAAGQMVAGQQLDLEAEGRSLRLEDIAQIHAGKTAALIRFSVRAGGVIAGADQSEMESLGNFGQKLGLLFQITDDILDITASSEELGKTAGKDVASRKATYPEVLGLDRARAFADEIEAEALQELGAIRRDCSLISGICKYVSSRSK